MKVKFFAILAALLMIGALAVPASAQYEITNDVIFVRLGYSAFTAELNEIKVGNTVVDADPSNLEGRVFHLVGEYNLNASGFLIGFGMEYMYNSVTISEDSPPDSEFVFQYIAPSVSAKFLAAGGLYVGAGLQARYLLSQSDETSRTDPESVEFDKKIDLWGNLIVGYIAPISEYYYFDVQGRFGYNLTNQQFSAFKVSEPGSSTSLDVDLGPQYDIAIYVGFGFRALASGI